MFCPGLSLAYRLYGKVPSRIWIYSGHDARTTIEQLKEVDGYILKSTDHRKLLQALCNIYQDKYPYDPQVLKNSLCQSREQVQQVQRFRCQLSKRQQDVLDSLLSGHRPQQIAQQMVLSTPTIHGYIRDIRQKAGVSTVDELKARYQY